MGYPFKKGDSTLCIDTKKAEACGIVFWQTAALAIVTNKPIPPTCFIHVEDLRTGAIIFASPKTVRTPTEQEESVVRPASTRWSKPIQTQEPATTSAYYGLNLYKPEHTAENWLNSHTVQTSSSSAGGNLTATNATASDNGIIKVDLSPEVTTPASPSSEPVATQDLTDSNHEGEDVASAVKPLAGGRQLIKGSPSGKAPDTDNTMPDRVEDSKQVLGETFKPDSLECENCGNYNSSQLVYCQNCAKILAAPDTTSEQKEHLARQIIESTLKDYGIYWRPLLDRGVPSDEAAVLKEARNKVKRATAWGKTGLPQHRYRRTTMGS